MSWRCGSAAPPPPCGGFHPLVRRLDAWARQECERAELLVEDSDLDPLRADQRFQVLVDEAFEQAGERRDPIDHGRYRSAQEGLEFLRDSGSREPDAWFKVGTRLLQLRQLDAAAEALANAASYDSESPSTA